MKKLILYCTTLFVFASTTTIAFAQEDFFSMARDLKAEREGQEASVREQNRQRQAEYELFVKPNEKDCARELTELASPRTNSWTAELDRQSMELRTAQYGDTEGAKRDVCEILDRHQRQKLRKNCLTWEEEKSKTLLGAEGLIFDESRFSREICYTKSQVENNLTQNCQDFREMQSAYRESIALGPIGRAHKWPLGDIRRTPDRLAAQIQTLVATMPSSFNLGACSGEYPSAGVRYSVAKGHINVMSVIEQFEVYGATVAINRQITFSARGCKPMTEELTHGSASMTIVVGDRELPLITFVHFPLLNYDATIGEYAFLLDGGKKVRLSRNDLIDVLNKIFTECRLTFENEKCITASALFQFLSKDAAAAEKVAAEIKAILKERLAQKTRPAK
jgi:hypothetical protein